MERTCSGNYYSQFDDSDLLLIESYLDRHQLSFSGEESSFYSDEYGDVDSEINLVGDESSTNSDVDI